MMWDKNDYSDEHVIRSFNNNEDHLSLLPKLS